MTVGRHRGKAARGFEAPVACGAGAEGVWSGGGGRVRAGGSGEGEVRRTLSRIVCCVHWPSGLIDSSLMEASVCRSARVWGLWGQGRGRGFSRQRGSALVEYRIRQIIPIGWVDVFIITPTLPVRRACAGVCGVSGVRRGWAGEGEGLGEGWGPRGGCGHGDALRFGQLACLGRRGRRRCCDVDGSSSCPRVARTCGEEDARVRIGQVRVGQVAMAWKRSVPRQNMSYRDESTTSCQAAIG